MSTKISRHESEDARDIGEPVPFGRIDDITLGAIKAAMDLEHDVLVDYFEDERVLRFRAIPRDGE